MNVNELLDTIEDTLEESAGMPLSGGKRIVDVEQIRDYLDEIRQNLPVELRQAQSIVSDRAQLIESANAQAQAIVKKAEERARVLVSEAEIVKAAQQRAGEIVSAAQTEARTVRQTVTDYCDNMLKTTEETMAENALAIRGLFCYNKIVSSRLTGPQTPGRPQAAFPGSSSGQKRAADAGSYLSFERRLGTWTQKKQHSPLTRPRLSMSRCC